MSASRFLTVPRGDSGRYQATIRRNGNPVRLTGASLRFAVKWRETDDDAAAVVMKTTAAGITVDDADQGIVTVTVDPADTAGLPAGASLHWDLQLTEADGEVTTVGQGRLLVTGDIARTSP